MGPKGARLRRRLWPADAGRLCRRVEGEKVLKFNRPFWAGGFLGLTGLRPEGCGLPLRGNKFLMPPVGGMARYARPPFPLRGTSPASGSRTPRALLRAAYEVTASRSFVVPPARGGKVVPQAPKGVHFHEQSEVVWFLLKWRPSFLKAPPPFTIYNSPFTIFHKAPGLFAPSYNHEHHPVSSRQ